MVTKQQKRCYMKTVQYDRDLNIEAYHFKGNIQPFPNHFHEYYVLGCVEQGKRHLTCNNNEYIIKSGDILLFNPKDNHGCSDCDNETFDYRSINIPADIFQSLCGEIVGHNNNPMFLQNVITDEEIKVTLKNLHSLIISGGDKFEKEETLFVLLSTLIERYSTSSSIAVPKYENELEKACLYMKSHCHERISLNNVCKHCNCSKSALLRAFTKSFGITPYRYLQSIRVDKAKSLLEQGVSPIDVAMKAGFFDQSHFTKYFSMYIGLTPGTYRNIFKNENEKR